MRKRTKVCVRRMLYLLTVLTGAVCAWNIGPLLLENALHGWRQLPQLAAAFGISYLAVQVSGWLGE